MIPKVFTQEINLEDGRTITIETGKLAKLRMVVTSDGPSRTVTWAAGGGGTLRKDSAFPGSFSIASTTQPKIVDFWTSDGGTIVYAQFVGTFGT